MKGLFGSFSPEKEKKKNKKINAKTLTAILVEGFRRNRSTNMAES